MVREASTKVYEALLRACTKHSEHLALLCIEPIYESIKPPNSNQIKFRIAFSRFPLTGIANETSVSDQDEPMWFMIDSLRDESIGASLAESINDKYVVLGANPAICVDVALKFFTAAKNFPV